MKIKLIYSILIMAVSFSSNAHKTYDLDSMDTHIILGNRNFVNDEVILWRENRNSGSDASDVEISALSSPAYGGPSKNIEIFYKNKLNNVSLFKEHARPMDSEKISKVIKAKHLPLIIIETTFHNSGATGNGSDGKNLYVYLFNNTKIEKKAFGLTDNWRGDNSLNVNNRYYSLQYGISHGRVYFPYLSLSSLSKNTIYNLNVAELSFDLVLDESEKVNEPSFDCRKAESLVDRTICRDIGLSALDSIMGDFYVNLKNSQLTVKGQKSWLRLRNNCSKNRPRPITIREPEFIRCLASQYKHRILELEHMQN